jgi:hypothetical protein
MRICEMRASGRATERRATAQSPRARLRGLRPGTEVASRLCTLYVVPYNGLVRPVRRRICLALVRANSGKMPEFTGWKPVPPQSVSCTLRRALPAVAVLPPSLHYGATRWRGKQTQQSGDVNPCNYQLLSTIIIENKIQNSGARTKTKQIKVKQSKSKQNFGAVSREGCRGKLKLELQLGHPPGKNCRFSGLIRV